MNGSGATNSIDACLNRGEGVQTDGVGPRARVGPVDGGPEGQAYVAVIHVDVRGRGDLEGQRARVAQVGRGFLTWTVWLPTAATFAAGTAAVSLVDET